MRMRMMINLMNHDDGGDGHNDNDNCDDNNEG